MRAVVLTATGEKHFCTGADLRAGRPAPEAKPEGMPERLTGDAARMIRTGIQRLIGAFLDCEKPIIAAVNGTAAGGGVAMVLASDLVIAADHARLIQVFVRRGLIPDGGPTYLLPRSRRHCTRRRSSCSSATTCPRPRPSASGSSTRSCPAPSSRRPPRSGPSGSAQGPTRTIAYAKQLLNRSLESTRASMFEQEAMIVEMVAGTADSTEGVASFVERRPTEFKGY